MSSLREQAESMQAERKEEVQQILAEMQAASLVAEREQAMERERMGLELVEGQKKLRQLTEECDRLRCELKSAVSDAEKLKKKLKEHGEEHEIACEQIRQENIEKLRSHVNLISNSFEDTRKELADARAKAFQTERAKAAADGVCETYKRRLDEAHVEMAALKKLRVESDEMTRSLVVLQARNRSNETIIVELTERARRAEADLRESEKSNKLMERTHAVHIARLEILGRGGGGPAATSH